MIYSFEVDENPFYSFEEHEGKFRCILYEKESADDIRNVIAGGHCDSKKSLIMWANKVIKSQK